jgi:phage tail-like protein
MAVAALKPLTTFNFFVELDGVNLGFFKECSGVDSETEIIEHKEITPEGKMVIRKVPGAMKWADITLKKSIDAAKDLWDWRKQVETGDVDNARRNGSVVMVDHKGGEVARWNFFDGWPSKWKGADLNAGENNVAIEEITITHEGLERA